MGDREPVELTEITHNCNFKQLISATGRQAVFSFVKKDVEITKTSEVGGNLLLCSVNSDDSDDSQVIVLFS